MKEIESLNLNGEKITLRTDELNLLKDRIKGDIIFPTDNRYNEARKIWNGLIDKKPAVIVKVRDAIDVKTVVQFARKNNIQVSARGGGHNVSGNSMNDGGIVIDFEKMKKIKVLPDLETAIAEPGATWADLDNETQKYGFAVPGGVVSDTGIAGLTLGGGLGWLRRKYGLSCDNLLSVEIVTGAGELLTASESENQDLFWAVRGGGGNFGIVTSFRYKLHNIGKELYMCLSFQPIESAAETLSFFRKFTASASDEINTFAVIGKFPPLAQFPEEVHGKPFILLTACYAGKAEEGEKALSSMINYGKPLIRINAPMPYLEIQKIFDEDYPHGRFYYWKSIFFQELNDDVSKIINEAAANCPSSLSTIDVWHLGGAIRKNREGAFPDRDSEFMLGIEANWDDLKESEKNIAWTRNLYALMTSQSSGGSYINFPGFHEEQSETFFSQNQKRIEMIKSKYDPMNLFRLH
jgi:hypothetical protein